VTKICNDDINYKHSLYTSVVNFVISVKLTVPQSLNLCSLPFKSYRTFPISAGPLNFDLITGARDIVDLHFHVNFSSFIETVILELRTDKEEPDDQRGYYDIFVYISQFCVLSTSV